MKKLTYLFLIAITCLLPSQLYACGQLEERYENKDFGIGIKFPSEMISNYTVVSDGDRLFFYHTPTYDLFIENGHSDSGGLLFSIARFSSESSAQQDVMKALISMSGIPLFRTDAYSYIYCEPTDVQTFGYDYTIQETLEYNQLAEITDRNGEFAWNDVYPLGNEPILRAYRQEGLYWFMVPADWQERKYQGEDTSVLTFKTGADAEFNLTTGEYWLVEGSDGYRTKDEFISIYKEDHRDFSVQSIDKVIIDEQNAQLEGQKTVFAYMQDVTPYTRICFDIIVGLASYSFNMTFPSSEMDIYNGVMDTVIDTLYFNNPYITYTDSRTGMTVDFPTSWRDKYGITVLSENWDDKVGFHVYHDDGVLITFIKWLGEYADETPPVLDGVPQTIIERHDGFTYTYSIPDDIHSNKSYGYEYKQMAESLNFVKNRFRILESALENGLDVAVPQNFHKKFDMRDSY